MKFLIVCVLALASAAAFDLRPKEIHSRQRFMPANRHAGRIAGGENADITNFNYQVGLSLKKGLFKSFWCGGSLIASEWILTAAHCMEDVYKITVYLGDTKRAQAEVEFDIVRNSDNVIVHEGFNSNTMLNDIALIRIPPVKFSEKIKPLRLNKNSCNGDGTFPGDFATATGSGKLGDNVRAVPNSLQLKDCNDDGTFPGDFDTASDSDQLGDTDSDALPWPKKNCNDDGTFPGDFDAASDSDQLGNTASDALPWPTKNCNDGTFPGDFATASGWGHLGDNARSIPTTLQSVTLRIISNEECARIFSRSIITDGNICLSTKDDIVMRSTCDGDSGGPLVLKGTNLQIGLTSFGAKKGCELGYPVAFIRISSFIDWIVAKTGITV